MKTNEVLNIPGKIAKGQVRFNYRVLAWEVIVEVTGPNGTYIFSHVDIDDESGMRSRSHAKRICATINTAFE